MRLSSSLPYFLLGFFSRLKLQMAECEGDGRVSPWPGKVIYTKSWYRVHGLLWSSPGALFVVFLCNLFTLLNPFLSPCKRKREAFENVSTIQWQNDDLKTFYLLCFPSGHFCSLSSLTSLTHTFWALTKS